MIAAAGLHFERPVWLLAALAAAPMAYVAWSRLSSLGGARRIIAIVLRVLVVVLLAVVLARPAITRTAEDLTVIAVVDRSRSIPEALSEQAMAYLREAAAPARGGDRLAAVDVAEAAVIASLPGGGATLRSRQTTLSGAESRLADGIEVALAIAPPDAGARVLLVSDGNETSGDLLAAARAAAPNGVPVDVLPLRYRHEREVVFRRVAAPTRARSNQTIPLRFVLGATAPATGRLVLTLNDRTVDLDPTGDAVGSPVSLRPGTNVKTVSLPVGTRGIHDFRATFVPDDSSADGIPHNNAASAMTFVAGPGHVIVADTDGQAGRALAAALETGDIDVRHIRAEQMPEHLPDLLGCDAIVLADVDNSAFTLRRQQMLAAYVTELGGGLVMTGGPNGFGAGGWIGSPVAEVMPVDMDPPQKKQMPKGALVLVIDRSGSMHGEKLTISKSAAVAAVRGLSRLDRVGVVTFDTVARWRVPIRAADDKDDIARRIRPIGPGGGTDMHAGLEAAAGALGKEEVGVKHVILLSDGQTAGADCRALARNMAEGRITVSTVAVGPDADRKLLYDIATTTGGRYHPVTDPRHIPQIFVKEAQVISRSLIVEKHFSPKLSDPLSDLARGVRLTGAPALEGFVLTGPRGGLARTVLVGPDDEPILAGWQSGLGKAVAFTSSADSRWAPQWVGWGGFDGFWEQVVRWVGKPAQSTELEVFADVEGRRVTVTVEAADEEGRFLQLARLDGQAVSPDIESTDLSLRQVGPGRYQGAFRADAPGGYLLNLRYRKPGDDETVQLVQSAVTVPYAPEFRDLSDNAGLLEQVARTTGGRVLSGDPRQADLWSRAGVSFPRSARPLTTTLLLIWVALFLLDVASRRIAVDYAAVGSRVRAAVRRLRRRPAAEGHLDRLRTRRQELLETLRKRARPAGSGRRYTGGEEYAGSTLDEARPDGEPDAPAGSAARQSEAPVEADGEGAVPDADRKPPAETAHLDRLLRAKRRTRE